VTSFNLLGLVINLDFSSNFFTNLANFGSQDPVTIIWQLFIHGGWLIYLGLVLFGVYEVWIDNRRGEFAGKWKHVMNRRLRQ
jgi:hypothetical protein